MKFTLTLNSHALSNFQECETKYFYQNLLSIEGLGSKFAMDRGTQVAKFLELYYYNKIKPHRSILKQLNNAIAWTNRFQKRLDLDSQEAFSLYRTCVGYTNYWKGETLVPLAVEKGFSKILYEDDDNLFIWEGRPDLIAKNGSIIQVIDHKTQGKSNSIYAFNNQARGYLWGLDANEFLYNYIVFTKVPQFRREPHSFTPNQLKEWQETTIEWFFRVKHSIESKTFLQSWQCTGIYRLCEFTKLCEQPVLSTKKFVLSSQFKTKKPYRSW